MSVPDSIVQAQMEALLRRVAREQEARSRSAHDAAGEQARAIVARAWQEARTRLRQAVEDERRGIEHAIANRRAALDTAARQREQSVLRELMDDAWRSLPAVLARRWSEPEARGDWCRAACAVAERSLHAGSGLAVEVDADATGDVVDAACRALEAMDPARPEVRRIDGLGPGLRIRRGLACVDATTQGLLASRDRIEAELLAEFGRRVEQRGAES